MSYETAIAEARAAYGPDPPSFAVLDKRGEFLRGKGGNVTSQYGEDGLIAAVLEKIGVKNGCCFEVGAGNGVYLSNTWALRQDGWDSVLIESDDEQFRQLSDWECEGLNQTLIHQKISAGDLDKILAEWFEPRNPDLGVIDIDGEDIKVWRGLKDFRPRIVLIEYNALGDGPLWLNGPWQAGFDSVVKLGREKGYVPLARTSCNLLFVDRNEIA